VPGEAPLVALATAYEAIVGRALPVAGMKLVSDANLIVRAGGFPALRYGPSGATRRADEEYGSVADLMRAAAVYAETIRRYPGLVG